MSKEIQGTAGLLEAIRQKGRVWVKDSLGQPMEWVLASHWSSEDGQEGTALLFDLFQIRSICPPFSEVSLDIVQFASKPTVYHSPVNSVLQAGPVKDGIIRFSVIKHPTWNGLLFSISQVVFAKYPVQVPEGAEIFVVDAPFLLQAKGHKALYLDPEGGIKILKA
ncbi:hypothetical protein A3SI_18417 [Nitritalea halalkaliphila LW7]|uniref:Uncharacterized protein n=1 Tax=Nitritalea halalkaliphila LW7 TaxID=1189621 RepID=I5BU29_9BACT|nr:hypothetical protein [Nitritalea halalkaliphila]EIM73081.1 hypothetical protein A3SI_18417 [Nitritalea halalkaliphila LW7]